MNKTVSYICLMISVLIFLWACERRTKDRTLRKYCWNVVSYYVNDADSTSVLLQNKYYNKLKFYPEEGLCYGNCLMRAGTNCIADIQVGTWRFDDEFETIVIDTYHAYQGILPFPIGAFSYNFPGKTTWNILELKKSKFIIETVQNGNRYYLEFEGTK